MTRRSTRLATDQRILPYDAFLTSYAPLDFVDSANSTWLPISLAASATPHSKGGWVEAVSSTSDDIYGLELNLRNNLAIASTDTSTLIDVGVGASGLEQVVIPEVNVGYAKKDAGRWEIPIFIPKGSRIALRCQSVIASESVGLFLRGKIHRSLPIPGSKCIVIGSDPANSRGTVITAAQTNTWVELTSSLPERICAVTFGYSHGGDTSIGVGVSYLDIGVGNSGFEEVVLYRVLLHGSTDESTYLFGGNALFGVDIPTGARICARWSGMAGTATDVDVSFIGIPWRP